MDLFGFNISRKGHAETEKSFVPPSEDGAIDTYRAVGGHYGTYLDLDGVVKNEADLIRRYREISMFADVDSAIDDVVNEAIANIDSEDPVTLCLDEVKGFSVSIKSAIEEEFEDILTMMDFYNKGQEYFRRWYIDGRVYFHKVIDTKFPKKGITDIRYVDPRKIRKVREVLRERDPATGVEFVKSTNEFFVFTERGLLPGKNIGTLGASHQTIRINKDSITFVPSGLIDQDTNMVLSYMHKAIKPANQLRMMENALVIYRLARAPERRIFYIDVGNLPKQKAEQYLKDIMARYRNKLVYDAETGEIRDDKKYMSMLEDFWLPRREGGRGTQIETLPGGQNLGEIADIDYFQRKLYQALNVPMSRLQQQGGLNFGRAAEITRDELKFTKFIGKLRRKFSTVFLDILKSQLLLKGIVTEVDWEKIREDIKFNFAQDAYYTESKQQELHRTRMELLGMAAPFDGKYFSTQYIQKEVLHLTDAEMSSIEKENKKNLSENPPMDPNAGPLPSAGPPRGEPKPDESKPELKPESKPDKPKLVASNVRNTR